MNDDQNSVTDQFDDYSIIASKETIPYIDTSTNSS